MAVHKQYSILAYGGFVTAIVREIKVLTAKLVYQACLVLKVPVVLMAAEENLAMLEHL